MAVSGKVDSGAGGRYFFEPAQYASIPVPMTTDRSQHLLGRIGRINVDITGSYGGAPPFRVFAPGLCEPLLFGPFFLHAFGRTFIQLTVKGLWLLC